jgi:YggT family protein
MEILLKINYWFFELLIWTIIIRVLLDWFGRPQNAFTNFVYSIADPILNSFRRFNLRIGVIDITPVVVIILLNILSGVIRSLLLSAL